MSYSRWSNSVWYTYWLVHTGPEEGCDAVLVVQDCGHFTESQLRADIDGCAESCRQEWTTDDHIAELKGYMGAFLADVGAERRTDA